MNTEQNQNSIDGSDIILAVCIIGGFWTGNWFPIMFFFGLYALVGLIKI